MFGNGLQAQQPVAFVYHRPRTFGSHAVLHTHLSFFIFPGDLCTPARTVCGTGWGVLEVLGMRSTWVVSSPASWGLGLGLLIIGVFRRRMMGCVRFVHDGQSLATNSLSLGLLEQSVVVFTHDLEVRSRLHFYLLPSPT